jgi:hypothetical protein
MPEFRPTWKFPAPVESFVSWPKTSEEDFIFPEVKIDVFEFKAEKNEVKIYCTDSHELKMWEAVAIVRDVTRVISWEQASQVEEVAEALKEEDPTAFLVDLHSSPVEFNDHEKKMFINSVPMRKVRTTLRAIVKKRSTSSSSPGYTSGGRSGSGGSRKGE